MTADVSQGSKSTAILMSSDDDEDETEMVMTTFTKCCFCNDATIPDASISSNDLQQNQLRNQDQCMTIMDGRLAEKQAAPPRGSGQNCGAFAGQKENYTHLNY